MGRWRHMCAGVALLAAVLAAAIELGPQSAVAQPVTQAGSGSKGGASTILIFDGSGSMWGKLNDDKRAKLDMARDAVRATLGRLAPQSVQLGLMSFGHRRASDCSDVQLIVAPDATDAGAFAERIMGPLDKLNPRGKGPLTAALREAAKLLGKQPAPRRIVLVHDDPDNCQADPCEAIAELQKSAPGVMISVVGLGLKPDEATRYQCLTTPTSGRHFNAQDSGQVTAGINAALVMAANTGPAPGIARPPPPTAGPEAATVAPAAAVAIKPLDLERTGPPALHLRALLAKDRIPIGHRVHWTIFAAGAADGTAPVAEADGAEAVAPVPAGSYRIHANAGLVVAETTATVGSEGQVAAELTFNAAEIRLTARPPGDAILIVAVRDGDAKPEPKTDQKVAPLPALARRLGLWPHGESSLLVPARNLWVLLEQGALRAQWPVDMSAGQARLLDTAQSGGRIEVTLAPTAGPAVTEAGLLASQPVVFTLEEDDPDAPRGRREIARSAASRAEFVVPSGVYMIAASRGTLETRERISVGAGDVVQRALPLVAARLILGARLSSGNAAPQGEGTRDSFRVTRLDTEIERTIVMLGPAAIADVPPGRYRIEARRNNAAIKAEQVVDVRAGDYRPVTLEYQAGELRVNVQSTADSSTESTFWRVVDATGRLVWSGNEPASANLVQVGRYAVRWVAQGRPREQLVDVRAGTVSAVRIGMSP